MQASEGIVIQNARNNSTLHPTMRAWMRGFSHETDTDVCLRNICGVHAWRDHIDSLYVRTPSGLERKSLKRKQTIKVNVKD
jgi:hypothetical protein